MSKVEKSDHYKEIVDLLLQGESSRAVSSYLKNEYNEDISFATINTYRKNHLNIKNRVNKKLIEKKKRKEIDDAIDKVVEQKFEVEECIEEAVDKGVVVRELLQLIISYGPEYFKNNIINNSELYPPTVFKLILEAAKQEHDWIKTDESEVNITLTGGSRLVEAINKSREKQ